MTLNHLLKLGFGMEGLENKVAEIVTAICAKFERPTYVEIGVGHGGTLVGVTSVMSGLSEEWRAIGIELSNGYSFDKAATKQNAVSHGLRLDYCNGLPKGKIIPSWNCITVILENSHVVLANHWQEPIHLALIDGCHGKACVTLDFLCLEPFIEKGGIVMFHDFGSDQIGQCQPHCGSLDVRGAARDLKLLDNNRPGWFFLYELIGNKQQAGANMGVFQKV